MNIQLPDFIIADLYKNSLVVIGDEVTNNTAEVLKANKNTELPDSGKQDIVKPVLQWLGDNKKRVTILVDDPANVHIGDASLKFLTNILAACKLTIADVAVINISKKNANYQEIIAALQSKYLFLFGISATAVNIPFPLPDYVIEEKNNCCFLSAGTLETMNQDTPEAKTEKGKLWGCLKTAFNV